MDYMGIIFSRSEWKSASGLVKLKQVQKSRSYFAYFKKYVQCVHFATWLDVGFCL